MTRIHPTALISPEVEIGEGVEVGPYTVIRGKVRIGKGTRIESHVCVGMGMGHITIGENNHIFPGSVIGTSPQDMSYKGENTGLVLGDGNTVREYTTISLGTPRGGGLTKVGHHNLLMAYVHIAHDCRIGDHVIIANESQFSGRVTVEDRVVVSGACKFVQFVTLGQFCFIGGSSTVNKDVLPFSTAQGYYAVMRATNKVGLQRAHFSPSDIELIHRALRYIIKGQGTVKEALERIKRDCLPSEHVDSIINFVKNSQRSLAL